LLTTLQFEIGAIIFINTQSHLLGLNVYVLISAMPMLLIRRLNMHLKIMVQAQQQTRDLG